MFAPSMSGLVDQLRIREHGALGGGSLRQAEAAVVDHQPAPVAGDVGARHELGDFLADAAVDDDQRMRLAGRPVVRTLEPAVQLVAVGRRQSYFLDAAGGGEVFHVLLVERARAEDKRLFERLEERCDASGGDYSADHRNRD
jgi:hypothetical protein